MSKELVLKTRHSKGKSVGSTVCLISDMSVSSDLGISPVLLQAISSLTSSEGRSEKVSVKQEHRMMDRRQTNSKVVSHLLQGMNEPVSGLLPASSPNDANQESDRDKMATPKQEEVTLNAAIQERLASHIVMNQGRVLTASSVGGSPSAADVSMVNVLTALASQHMRANIKQEETDSFSPVVGTTITTTTAAAADVVVRSGSDNSDERPQPQIIIYYNNESGSVPSPGNDVIVGELEGDGVQGSVQNYRVVMHHGDAASARVTAVSESSMQQMVSEAAVAAAAASTSPGTFVAADSNCTEAGLSGICPICGDKLSGTGNIRLVFVIM